MGGSDTRAYTFWNPISYIDPLGLETGAAYRVIYLADSGARQDTGGRAPDFIQLSASVYVFSGSITLSRSGNIFTSGGIGREYPNPVRGLGFSLNAGSLMSYCQDAKEQGAKADKFLTGLSYSATAHNVVGGGVAYSPDSGGAVLFGVGGGVEVSPGSVGTQTPWSLPAW